jgi:hypothetical protein
MMNRAGTCDPFRKVKIFQVPVDRLTRDSLTVREGARTTGCSWRQGRRSVGAVAGETQAVSGTQRLPGKSTPSVIKPPAPVDQEADPNAFPDSGVGPP